MPDATIASERPDLERFQKDERPRDFEVEFDVRGTIRMSVEASSREEARWKAKSMMLTEDFGRELDHVDGVEIVGVIKSPGMFLITRDGSSMRTSHLHAGDEPRSPDESGF